jgi:hypothetical protein
VGVTSEPKLSRFAHSPTAQPGWGNHALKGDLVRFKPAHVTVAISVVIGALGAIGVSPCIAQTSVASLDELRRELGAGDVVTLVPAAEQPMAGQLMRIGDVDLDLRLFETGTPRERALRTLTVPLDAIQSLERRRDSSRNGAGIGAAIGAGFGGAFFVHALLIDRNEVGEWATPYVGVAAICTAIGALVGWAIDAASSKPHVRFEASSRTGTRVSVRPLYSRDRGMALAVSISRYGSRGGA